jgi:hypothetical protein
VWLQGGRRFAASICRLIAIATQAIILYTFSPFSLPRNNSLLLVPGFRKLGKPSALQIRYLPVLRVYILRCYAFRLGASGVVSRACQYGFAPHSEFQRISS